MRTPHHKRIQNKILSFSIHSRSLHDLYLCRDSNIVPNHFFFGLFYLFISMWVLVNQYIVFHRNILGLGHSFFFVSLYENFSAPTSPATHLIHRLTCMPSALNPIWIFSSRVEFGSAVRNAAERRIVEKLVSVRNNLINKFHFALFRMNPAICAVSIVTSKRRKNKKKK